MSDTQLRGAIFLRSTTILLAVACLFGTSESASARRHRRRRPAPTPPPTVIPTPTPSPAATPATPPAAIIYVDPSGSDDLVTGGKRGTTRACATLARALQLAQSTDEIVVNPGAYRNVAATSVHTPNVFISGYGATFVASSVGTNVLTFSAPGGTVAGLTIDGGRTTQSTFHDCGLINIQADNVTVVDCTVRNDIANGIRIVGPVINSQVRNNTCSNLFAAIQAYGKVDDALIARNTISNGWSATGGSGGIKLTNSTISGGAGTNYTIRDNTVDRAGEMGIEAWIGWTNGLIDGNTVRFCTFDLSQDTGSGTTLSNNVLFGGSYCAIELVNAHGIVMSNNTMDGLQADGSTYGPNAIIASGPPSTQCNLTGNIFSRYTCSINLQGAAAFNISYNTINRDRPGQSAIGLLNSTGTTIVNNNIRQTRTDCSYVLLLDASNGYVDNTNFSNNTVESDNGAYYYSMQGYRGGGGYLVRNTLITGNTFVNHNGQIQGYNAWNIPMVTENPGSVMLNTTVSNNQPVITSAVN